MGLRPTHRDENRQPTGTMANQATRLGFGRFSRGSLFVVEDSLDLGEQPGEQPQVAAGHPDQPGHDLSRQRLVGQRN